MQTLSQRSDLLLGQVGGYTVRLTPATLHTSFAHAQQIASALGIREAETSMAAYWSLAHRLQQWQAIIDRVGHEHAGRLRFLEVGSGLGLFVLVGQLLGLRVLGVESSSDRYQLSLRIAQALCVDNGLSAPFINAYAEALPLPDASVDVVASFHTFEHVHSVERTLREIRRVLAPGGRLFAQVPNYASFYEPHYGVLAPLGLGKTWMRRRLRLSGRPTKFLEHLQWLTPAELRMQLAQAGFSAVRVTHIPRRGPERATIAASASPLPFRFRRGAFVGRFARALALLGDKLKISADWYPNIEIWAEA